MARNLRGSTSLRRSVRHRSSWEVGPQTSGGGAPQAIGASVAQAAGTGMVALVDGITLIRTRGELLMWLVTANAAGDGYHGAFGIAKATAAAFTSGIASVPTPITEDSWDGWLYHRFFSIHSVGAIGVSTAADEQNQSNNVTAALRIEVDSKAMRKIDIDEVFYAAIEVTEHGTADMEWAFNSRTLVKEM